MGTGGLDRQPAESESEIPFRESTLRGFAFRISSGTRRTLTQVLRLSAAVKHLQKDMQTVSESAGEFDHATRSVAAAVSDRQQIRLLGRVQALLSNLRLES